MAAKTAQQMSANWGRRMSDGSTRQAYIDGINGTTVNPMAEAASPDAMQKYLQAVQDSVSSGRRAQALLAASPTIWKQNALNMGASNLANGAKKGQPKMDAHFQDWAATYQQASAAAKAIKGTGRAASLQRIEAVLNLYASKSGKNI